MPFSSRATLLLSGAVLLACVHPASAVVTVTENIACSSIVKLQKRIDALVAGKIGTYNVTGVCNENIVVPQGKTVIINGANAVSSIAAATPSRPALVSYGDTTIQKMKVSNPFGTADYLVGAERGGQLNVTSSDLSAANVGTVVAAWVGSVRVVNSRVIGGKDDALEVGAAGNLVLKGDPLLPVGPEGGFSSYVKSEGSGILCGKGTFRVNNGVNGAATGSVTIEQSGTGISSFGCNFDIENATDANTNIQIRNNDTGIRMSRSTAEIDNAVISGNANSGIDASLSQFSISRASIASNGYGLAATQSNIEIDATLFNNSDGDLSIQMNSSVHFRDVNGASSFTKMNTWNQSLYCMHDSYMFAEVGSVNEVPGDQYGQDCFYQLN